MSYFKLWKIALNQQMRVQMNVKYNQNVTFQKDVYGVNTILFSGN